MIFFYHFSFQNMKIQWLSRKKGSVYNPQIEIVSPAETKQYFNIFILKNEMV